MAPAARAGLAPLPRLLAFAVSSALPRCARAARRSAWDAPQDEGAPGALLEARSGAGEGARSEAAKNLYEEFFANPALFAEPGYVSGDTTCGTWCSMFGGVEYAGKWAFSFGYYEMRKSFFSISGGPIMGYRLNDGKNLIVQWEGHRRGDAEEWASTFGGSAKWHLMLAEGKLDVSAEKALYRISSKLGMGDNTYDVWSKMCTVPASEKGQAPVKVDGESLKFAIPLEWDDWRENSNEMRNEAKRYAKMRAFQHGLLVLKYSCKWSAPTDESPGEFNFEKISIYLMRA